MAVVMVAFLGCRLVVPLVNVLGYELVDLSVFLMENK